MIVRNEVQAVVFDEKNREILVLLIKKKDQKTGQYNWRLLKGGIKSGETKIKALVREIFEEIGLRNVTVLKEIHGYKFPFRDVEHRVSGFLVKADSKEPIDLRKSEVADYVWAKKEEAFQMLCWPDEKKLLEALSQIE